MDKQRLLSGVMILGLLGWVVPASAQYAESGVMMSADPVQPAPLADAPNAPPITAPEAAPAPAPITVTLPSGHYVLDPKHTSVIFKISHLGFSNFTGRFDRVEGTLDFVADAPQQSKLDITIYPNSIDTNVPELDEDLRGGNWFDTVHYQMANLRSTMIQPIDNKSVRVTGAFNLRGTTRPVVMDVTLVGQGKNPVTGDYSAGFTGTILLKRGEYGIANLEPMVGDDVTIQVDTEFDLKTDQ
ncbi:MAG: YceI family protein [Alphaproteobacteria bacterium]|nr:YceI family protein [Alphaproteobacteria bacterium]